MGIKLRFQLKRWLQVSMIFSGIKERFPKGQKGLWSTNLPEEKLFYLPVECRKGPYGCSFGEPLEKRRGILILFPMHRIARLPELVWLSGLRWPVGQCFEETKTELGMDQYEVRKFPGWHHHILTCMLGHYFLWHLKIRLGKKSTCHYAPAA